MNEFFCGMKREFFPILKNRIKAKRLYDILNEKKTVSFDPFQYCLQFIIKLDRCLVKAWYTSGVLSICGINTAFIQGWVRILRVTTYLNMLLNL